MKLFVRENQNLAETEVEIRCNERDTEVENRISQDEGKDRPYERCSFGISKGA